VKQPRPDAKALKTFTERFEKAFGAGTLVNTPDVNPYEVISSGSLALDYATGVGGLVEGRLHEYWGQDSLGKTMMALLSLAEAQRKHPAKVVGFIDVEQKSDRAWMVAHGVDLARSFLYQPDSAEDVADAMKEMLRSGQFSMIVLDSIGAMLPEAEKERDADQAVMATQARIVTRMVKIAAVEARRCSAVVLFINQARANLSGYGKATTTGGGFALKHATTMKMEFKRTGTPLFEAMVAGEKRVVGHELAIRLERNNVAPPHRTATICLHHTPSIRGPLGIDRADEAVTIGLACGVIVQHGGWYTLPTGERHQGRDKLAEALRASTDLLGAVRTAALSTTSIEIYDEEVVIPEAEESVEEAAVLTPKFRRTPEG